LVDKMDDREIERMHDEMIDECYDEVRIGSLCYSPSWVLKQVDPIAYRCSVAEYEDMLREDGLLDEEE